MGRSDLIAGHARLAAQPGIDAARIDMFGQLYGGWMALAAITYNTEGLPRSTTTVMPISGSCCTTTGSGAATTAPANPASPTVPPLCSPRSRPFTSFSRVSAPLLVCHGDRDPRVPKTESGQFVACMEQKQKKVRDECFDYAGHGFIPPSQQSLLTAVIEFFAAHLRGDG